MASFSCECGGISCSECGILVETLESMRQESTKKVKNLEEGYETLEETGLCSLCGEYFYRSRWYHRYCQECIDDSLSHCGPHYGLDWEEW